MNTIIIQPPLVQLNTPYPAGAYLKSFFKSLNSEKNIKGEVQWFDLSTALFHEIFSEKGLSRIFEKTQKKALNLAEKFENQGDDNSAYQLRRYVSQSDMWCSWIDTIIAVLCPEKNKSGREYVHEFVRSAHVPRGNRMERFLSELGRDVTVDDSRILASLALADLADYITAVYDSDFALIRYAERLAVSTSTFDEVLNGLNAPVLTDFFEPLLEKTLGKIIEQSKADSVKMLFCISVPFPGCFEAALFAGRWIRGKLGSNALIALGGGYVNTELRNLNEKRLFEFCDFISYDKGYGSYIQLFENDFKLDGKKYYKTKYLKDGNIVNFEEHDAELEKREALTVYSLIPDFSGIDFSLYPRMADDTNPMHRIWNDGAWLKAYMAYGCYWHRCAFCDTQLDYVKGYCGTDISNLYDGLYEQAEKSGVYGIHFVDEACPPKAMESFALKNLSKAEGTEKKRLTWWGNIRFEKAFTRDAADLLSAGGLTAVSGGIEIATGEGLDSVNKGTTIENIVSACCAFKEAGILVHSYMIFGFWNQSEQDLINSMETLRQLFAEGLLDSAFWHKFSLTFNSTVYKEWLEGKHPDLKPLKAGKKQFAENALNFEGENKSQKYSEPLNQALECWMHGEKLKKNCESWFSFKMPKPTIPQDFISKLIEKYEQNRDKKFASAENNLVVWLGGKPVLLKSGKGVQLCWSYMGELLYSDEVSAELGNKAVQLLNEISAASQKSRRDLISADEFIESAGMGLYRNLRGKGLCSLI